MSRIRYSADEKMNALRLCDEVGVAKASEQTGITKHTLYIWRADAQNKASATTTVVEEILAGETVSEEVDAQQNHAGNSGDAAAAHNQASESVQEELIRLRIENAFLKTQMATLKNALRMFTE